VPSFERAITRVTEQAANANAIVDEAMDAGLDGSDAVKVHVKQLRAELLSVKSDLERELETVLLDCVVCGVPAHTSAASVYGPATGRTRNPRRMQRRGWRGRSQAPAAAS
jgi:hypothetical protein